jgi:hypothetical protein
LISPLSSLLAAALAVRVRFRCATGIERLQIKSLAYVACLIPATCSCAHERCPEWSVEEFAAEFAQRAAAG